MGLVIVSSPGFIRLIVVGATASIVGFDNRCFAPSGYAGDPWGYEWLGRGEAFLKSTKMLSPLRSDFEGCKIYTNSSIFFAARGAPPAFCSASLSSDAFCRKVGSLKRRCAILRIRSGVT